jgi:RNA polymerase sigma-70 factor (sigma-E family)
LRSASGNNGLHGGFDEFAAAAWPRLVRSAYLLTGDHHLAEDLAQTALVRTYAHWRRVRRSDALAYTRRVLVNLNIDRIRRKHGAVDVGDALLETVSSRPDHRVDERDEAVRLLQTLTDRERRIVVLRHYFDLSEAEVADELGVARGTVKSTLSRSLGKLRIAAGNGDRTYEEVVGQ